VVKTGGLENRCTGNGTGGSNPSPSATQSGLPEKSGYITSRIAENRRNSASGEYVRLDWNTSARTTIRETFSFLSN
jgi:hypothetical protein